jgi:hypothetical protein
MSEPINDQQIAGLCPTWFSGAEKDYGIDEEVRSQFFRIYKPLRENGLNPFDLSRVASALFYYRPLLQRLLKPTQSKTVVEIGSGRGLKAVSWADLFANYIGIELDTVRAEQSRELLKQLCVRNARIITDNAEKVLKSPQQYGIEKIDLLVMYAVLEHMTLAERRSVLQLADEVCKNGGHVLIAESPNRLSRFDSHSFQLPFVESLPSELLAQYVANSKREDLKEELYKATADEVPETLYRLGRGISFHEFECAWGKETLDDIGILNDGYSTELLNLQPFCREEWDLLRFCVDNTVGVRRMFTRYWIEGIFSGNSHPTANDKASYLNPAQITSKPALERRKFWELDEVTILSGEEIQVQISNESSSSTPLLLIDISRSSGMVDVCPRGGGASYDIDLAEIKNARLPSWHTQVALPIQTSGATELRITPKGQASLLTCQGILLV